MNPTGDIAIVGMAGLFPRAPDVATFWQNILDKVDAVTDRGADPGHPDRGGFLDGLVRFDPADHGVLPRSVDGADPEHFIALRLAREALADAGYLNRPFPRERTAVILGRANYGSRGYGTLFQHAVVVDQVIRLLATLHPEHSAAELAEIEQQLRASLPPFDADTAPGLVPNVMCGRIANRLDLMGSAYAVDAACASSLVAVELAMSELLAGKADLALAGGIHVSSTVPITMLFHRLGALSRRGAVRPFSADADGTLLGEGAGVVVLKRRADAERASDRVYALVKAVGVASDGRAVGVLAPRVEGEELAIRRAYDAAGVPPDSVALVEAHGTGTHVGDAVELEALGRVFGPRGDGGAWRALGSVKSMIGHPIPAAGVAGLIKTALALHHKVLPPTLSGGDHAAALESTPFHLNTETRPWIHAGPQPRRAAVSAFGFGGINAHAVLEEHRLEEQHSPGPDVHLHRRFDAEVLILSGRDRADLLTRGAGLRRVLSGAPDVALVDLAHTLNCAPGGMAAARLALVASSVADLDGKLALALDRLADPACRGIEERCGVYYTEAPLYVPGALAFLFPGQGAQYPNMLADLCVHFPEVRAWFDLMDRPFAEQGRLIPSRLLFPPPDGRGAGEPAALWAMDYGLATVYTANQALSGLLGRLGIRPDAVLGHSSGDFSAMWEAGILPVDDDAELIRQVVVLTEAYEQVRGEGRLPSGTLFAVSAADPEHVRAAVERSDGAVTVAMDNCPHQLVLGGPAAAAATAADELRRAGAVCTTLPFDYLPHTPYFAEFAARLHEIHRQREGQVRYRPPRTALYSSVTAARFPADPTAVRRLVADQWSHPVRFREAIEAMHADGVRIFVEAGPRGNLAGFTADVLRGTPHLAVPADVDARGGVTQLAHLVGLLAAHHVPMTLDHLYAYRSPRRLWTGDGPARVAPAEPDRSVRLSVDLPLLTLDRPAPEPLVPASLVSEPPVPAPPARTPREQVMAAYLDTMDRFLDVQRHAVRTHLNTPAPPRFPLLGSAVSHTEGRELVALRRLDPEQDLFLRDHTFGRAVSQADPSLLGLPVVPFTVSMELLAEAAATLCPGHVVVGVRQVRAHQWIALDDGPVTLRVVARRAGSGREITVELQRLGDDDSDGSQAGPRMVEGTVVLADCYPAPPEVAPTLTFRGERPCRQAGTSLYADRMFHGPRFQGVVSLDRWGEDGISATMTTLPTGDLFAATPEPTLLTDPQLLDAAGQLVGFWALEHHDRGSAFFPFGLDELQLFGPPPPAGTPVTGRARISMVGDAQLRSDLDLAGPDGRLLARLTGWASHRLTLPEPLARLGISPRNASLGTPWTALTARLPGALACCCIDDLPLGPHGRIWERALAQIVLNRGERASWSRLPGSDRDRSEWLLGRVAAKDAVRALLRTTSGVELCPADVEIVEEPDGRLLGAGPWIQVSPVVSLASRDGAAMAVAGHYRGIGVALEYLASDETDRTPAHPLIAALDEPLRAEWALRLRCAGKAALALGGEPSTGLVAADLDTTTGTVLLACGSERHGSQRRTVQTARDGDRIAALAIR